MSDLTEDQETEIQALAQIVISKKSQGHSFKRLSAGDRRARHEHLTRCYLPFSSDV